MLMVRMISHRMRAGGIEPPAKSLKGSCSTTELRPPLRGKYTAGDRLAPKCDGSLRRVHIVAHMLVEERQVALHEGLKTTPTERVPGIGIRPKGDIDSRIFHQMP